MLPDLSAWIHDDLECEMSIGINFGSEPRSGEPSSSSDGRQALEKLEERASLASRLRNADKIRGISHSQKGLLNGRTEASAGTNAGTGPLRIKYEFVLF